VAPTFLDELRVLRRFLRDPNGIIWDNEDLRFFWNDAQVEIATKVGFMERARAYRYPPSYTWSYTYDHELQDPAVQGDLYRCFMDWEADTGFCIYPWEPGYWESASSTPDDGYRFTHPWEGAQESPAAEVVKMPLDPAFYRTKFVAFNELKLEPLPKRELAKGDPFYGLRIGEPRAYYHPDAQSNQLVIFPKPAAVTWEDQVPGADTLRTDPTVGLSDTGGINTFVDSDLDESDTGIAIEIINIIGQLFMVFEAYPQDVVDYEDQLTYWPAFMLRVVRYGTLENAFGANTDGFIPSLRDYWKQRKDLGIQSIVQLKHGRMKDRDYRMGGTDKPWRSKRLRLPAGYPPVFP
jgi:hypothetical protein